MRLRTFSAADMPAAMKMVREALGDDAVILAQDTLQGKKGVRITAAVEGDDNDDQWAAPPPKPVKAVAAAPPRPTALTQDEGIDALRHELTNMLRFHNVPELFIAKMMQKATPSELSAIAALHRISGNRNPQQLHVLAAEKITGGFFRFAPLPFESDSLRILLAGPPGIGKTLTTAKMAARLVMDRQKVCVVTCDNKRAGGVEQLQAFTDILGLSLRVAANAGELAAAVKEQPPKTRVLVDTAGCNPYDEGEIAELAALAAVPTLETVLVLPAGGDSMETIDIVESFSALPARRLLITRTDTARRFGGILAAAAAHELAFCNASSSSSIVDPMPPVDGALLARMLLRYQLNPPKG